MKTRQKLGREGSMAIKLDIFKAYDKLEWIFLEVMMRKLGYNDVWISMIMTCVTTFSYSVLVNGQPSFVFQPFRGFFQGDPISSYLYLICLERFNTLPNEANMSYRIRDVKVARSSLTINHLFFVDDTIVFCRAKLKEWLEI